MNDQLEYMTGQVAKGTMTRREFVGRAGNRPTRLIRL
ncbi:hypothetical protein LCGC14_0866910 [marine sediment metagenome]|uniref:Uncharacterized protein n=1 Tax=marine sediment metagenome TaxID=412755 RepID=A0A0F9PRF0_9ZZZZ